MFDPRREHSSVPTAIVTAAARRVCQGWPRLRGHPSGLGLDGPEHGGTLDCAGIYGGAPDACFFSLARLRRLSPFSSMRWAL